MIASSRARPRCNSSPCSARATLTARTHSRRLSRGRLTAAGVIAAYPCLAVSTASARSDATMSRSAFRTPRAHMRSSCAPPGPSTSCPPAPCRCTSTYPGTISPSTRRAREASALPLRARATDAIVPSPLGSMPIRTSSRTLPLTSAAPRIPRSAVEPFATTTRLEVRPRDRRNARSSARSSHHHQAHLTTSRSASPRPLHQVAPGVAQGRGTRRR